MTPTLTAITGFTIIAGCFGVMVYRAKMHGKLTPAIKAEIARIEGLIDAEKMRLYGDLEGRQSDLDEAFRKARKNKKSTKAICHEMACLDCEIKDSMAHIEFMKKEIATLRGVAKLTLWDLLK